MERDARRYTPPERSALFFAASLTVVLLVVGLVMVGLGPGMSPNLGHAQPGADLDPGIADDGQHDAGTDCLGPPDTHGFGQPDANARADDNPVPVSVPDAHTDAHRPAHRDADDEPDPAAVSRPFIPACRLGVVQ